MLSSKVCSAIHLGSLDLTKPLKIILLSSLPFIPFLGSPVLESCGGMEVSDCSAVAHVGRWVSLPPSGVASQRKAFS